MALTEKETIRYNRHLLLNEVGKKGQEKLKQAKVLVVGCGGLGCPVLQYLVAAGIGTLGIIDFDVVEISNLQRQVLFDTSSLGKNKAIMAKNKLKQLNPLIQIDAYPEKLGPDNALDLFKKYDLIVDGTDNFATRYVVNDACIMINKPFVYGAIYRFEGQVAVFNYQQGPSYRCLFPKPPNADIIPNCSETGVLGILPGIIGSYQANEVLKMILGLGDLLSGKLLMINALTNFSSVLKIERSEEQFELVLNTKNLFDLHDDEFYCNSGPETKQVQEKTVREIMEQIRHGQAMQFVDVRTADEQPKIKELEGVQIPVETVVACADLIDKTKPTVVYCQSGIRSKKAVKYLQDELGYNNLSSLKGGVKAWLINNQLEV